MKQANAVPVEEKTIFRREVKKASSHAALGALLFTVIGTVIGIVALFIMLALNGQGALLLSDSFADLANAVTALPFVDYLDILTSLGGLLAVFLCFAKQGTHKQLFGQKNTMTLPTLAGLLCVMCLFDSVGVMLYAFLEQGLNAFGFSTATGVALASGLAPSAGALIGICLIGPVIEELVFRGFLLRRMEKCGKGVAIVITSVLFGLMHQNLPQVLAATMIGLVWGYVAAEYSLGWSIALHIFENLVRVVLLNNLLAGFSAPVQHIVRMGILAATAIIAIVIMIRKRALIRAWIQENLPKKVAVAWALCAPVTVLTITYYIVSTLRLIEKFN